MSTDTDYIITIKGKNAALRKAAADYIELLLNPWTPQRDNKKTLIRIDVFRNESNARGLLAPSSLCEDAAKLFPGTDVSFESKNEYGNTEEGQWNEEGSPPKDINGTVAVKALKRIQSDVESLENRLDWLIPLAEWASSNKVAKKSLEQVKEALKGAKVAKEELATKNKAEEELKIEQETKDALALEAATSWSFHPVLAAENRRIGTLGKPLIWKWASTQPNFSWIPCESVDVGGCVAEAIRQECTSVCIGFPILSESSEGQKFLETQLYNLIEDESPYVFLQTPGRFRGLGLNIHKHKETFFALLPPESTDGTILLFQLKKYFQIAEVLEGAGIHQAMGDKALAVYRKTYNERIKSDCLVCKDEYVFLAVDNVWSRKNPTGQIYCLSKANGKIMWSSEYRFHVCCALIVLESSSLMAVIGTAGSPFLICLDATSGQERWRKPLDESIGPSFRLAGSGNTVFLLSQGQLSWWKVSTGECFLKKFLPKEDSPELEIALDSKRVYVAGKSWITAFNLEGSDAWTVHLPKADWCKFALTGVGHALISRGELGVTCIKVETGATVWTAQDAKVWGALVGCNNIAFFTGDNCCTARNIIDGSLLWHKELNHKSSRFCNIPVLVNDKFFVIDTQEELLEWFDVSSGAEAGVMRFSPASSLIPTKSGLWVATQLFWLGSKGGETQVVCFNPKIGPPMGPWPTNHQGEGCASFLPSTLD